jgi:hypothetical protein
MSLKDYFGGCVDPDTGHINFDFVYVANLLGVAPALVPVQKASSNFIATAHDQVLLDGDSLPEIKVNVKNGSGKYLYVWGLPFLNKYGDPLYIATTVSSVYPSDYLTITAKQHNKQILVAVTDLVSNQTAIAAATIYVREAVKPQIYMSDKFVNEGDTQIVYNIFRTYKDSARLSSVWNYIPRYADSDFRTANKSDSLTFDGPISLLDNGASIYLEEVWPTRAKTKYGSKLWVTPAQPLMISAPTLVTRGPGAGAIIFELKIKNGLGEITLYHSSNITLTPVSENPGTYSASVWLDGGVDSTNVVINVSDSTGRLASTTIRAIRINNGYVLRGSIPSCNGGEIVTSEIIPGHLGGCFQVDILEPPIYTVTCLPTIPVDGIGQGECFSGNCIGDLDQVSTIKYIDPDPSNTTNNAIPAGASIQDALGSLIAKNPVSSDIVVRSGKTARIVVFTNKTKEQIESINPSLYTHNYDWWINRGSANHPSWEPIGTYFQNFTIDTYEAYDAYGATRSCSVLTIPDVDCTKDGTLFMVSITTQNPNRWIFDIVKTSPDSGGIYCDYAGNFPTLLDGCAPTEEITQEVYVAMHVTNCDDPRILADPVVEANVGSKLRCECSAVGGVGTFTYEWSLVTENGVGLVPDNSTQSSIESPRNVTTQDDAAIIRCKVTYSTPSEVKVYNREFAVQVIYKPLTATIYPIYLSIGEQQDLAVLVSGGTPGYTYLWDDFSQNSFITITGASQLHNTMKNVIITDKVGNSVTAVGMIYIT